MAISYHRSGSTPPLWIARTRCSTAGQPLSPDRRSAPSSHGTNSLMLTRRQIPFFNYPALFASQEREFMELLRDVLGRGAYILQKDLAEFEAALRKFLDVKHVLGVADGT